MIQNFSAAIVKSSAGVSVSRVKKSTFLKWAPPKESWVNFNTDGSFSADKKGACGRVLKDHEGKFIVGFTIYLGPVSVLQDVLWGLICRLRIALSKGFSKVFVESDSELAIRFLNKGIGEANPCAPMVRDIKRLLNQFTAHWRHVFIEAKWRTLLQSAENRLSLLVL